MNALKNTLGRLALYFFLMALNIIPCANFIPDSFPTRNLSTVYLLFLSICLVMYYSYRVLRTGKLSVMMRSLSWTAFVMIFLRGVKYSVFSGVEVLARHTWYLYYVPMLLLPLFLFFIALYISPEGGARHKRIRRITAAVSALLIVAVLTNDLHQQVFRFAPGFAGWDSDYSYGWLFPLVYLWQFGLYFAAVAVLAFKCRIVSSKKGAWLTVIPFSAGIVMCALLITGNMPKVNGTNIIEFPEALILMAASVLECCIQLGLIPTNKGYGKLFGAFPLSAQITDRQGSPVYLSSTAEPLSASRFAAPDGARTSGHTVQHKMELTGGFGFWQDDMTELDRLNEELSEAKEKLAQESRLIRLHNELKEKRTKVEQRTLLYDKIAERVRPQSQAITLLARTARSSSDPALKKECCGRIILLGAYIKRCANLMLLSDSVGKIGTGELALSVSEVLRYLNFYGIPGEMINTAQDDVPADAAIAVFEAFGTLLESGLDSLRGVFVNLSSKDGRVLFKLTLEELSAPLPERIEKKLGLAGVRTESVCEDQVTYLCFTFPKGGGEK